MNGFTLTSRRRSGAVRLQVDCGEWSRVLLVGVQSQDQRGAFLNDTDARMTSSVNPSLMPFGQTKPPLQVQVVSRRTVARGLGISIAEVKLQERKTTDLPLSTLHRWQKVLNVPLVELLVEPDDSLSLPLMKRARLVQLMKTVMSIMEQAKQTSVERFAQTMIGQLIEIMPELREVSSWPVVGQRRRRNEYGRAAERSLPEEVFTELAHHSAGHILEP